MVKFACILFYKCVFNSYLNELLSFFDVLYTSVLKQFILWAKIKQVPEFGSVLQKQGIWAHFLTCLHPDTISNIS